MKQARRETNLRCEYARPLFREGYRSIRDLVATACSRRSFIGEDRASVNAMCQVTRARIAGEMLTFGADMQRRIRALVVMTVAAFGSSRNAGRTSREQAERCLTLLNSVKRQIEDER